MSARFCGLLLMLGALMPSAGHAHAIIVRRIEGGVGVAAAYDDGTPAAFIDVKVFAPGERNSPTISAVADRNGCFMFRPDTVGVWRVTVDDGMGHARSLDIKVGGDEPRPDAAPARVSTVLGTVTGISLILAVFGWAGFLRLAPRRKT